MPMYYATLQIQILGIFDNVFACAGYYSQLFDLRGDNWMLLAHRP